MNKSLVTNSVASVICIIGYAMPESSLRPFVVSAGLFSLSGALTNWLAIHMLFEKVPGLYGSGVIVARFQEFKSSIHSLVMENFFKEENFKQFADAAIHQGFTSETIESVVDMNQAFDGFNLHANFEFWKPFKILIGDILIFSQVKRFPIFDLARVR